MLYPTGQNKGDKLARFNVVETNLTATGNCRRQNIRVEEGGVRSWSMDMDTHTGYDNLRSR